MSICSGIPRPGTEHVPTRVRRHERVRGERGVPAYLTTLGGRDAESCQAVGVSVLLSPEGLWTAPRDTGWAGAPPRSSCGRASRLRGRSGRFKTRLLRPPDEARGAGARSTRGICAGKWPRQGQGGREVPQGQPRARQRRTDRGRRADTSPRAPGALRRPGGQRRGAAQMAHVWQD